MANLPYRDSSCGKVTINIAYVLVGLPNLLTRELIDKSNAPAFDLLADFAEEAASTFQERGASKTKRPSDLHAHAIANSLAFAILSVTGHEPIVSTTARTSDRPGHACGPLVDLTRFVFGEAAIPHQPESFAAKAAFKMRGKGRRN